MIKNFNIDFFDKNINQKYYLSKKGYFEFDGNKKWEIECPSIKDKNLNPKKSSTKTKKFLKEILKSDENFTCVQDYSRTAINSECYNLQLISDNIELSLSHSICINISVIIPFFHIHVLELKRKQDNFAKWASAPIRNQYLEDIVYKDEICKIKKFLIDSLCLNEFPDSFVKKLVPNFFTEDISKGNFTYFNAFFQREYYTR